MTGYARYEVPFGSFDINEFRGYNATAAKTNSEMRDMMNLSPEKYPYLSPRAPRSMVEIPEEIGGISKIFRANGKLCYIADGKMWYDGKIVLQFPVGRKSVAVCNGKICVAPDLVYYDYLNDIGGRMDGKVSIVNITGACIKIFENDMRLVRFGSKYTNISMTWKDYLKVGDTIRFRRFTTDSELGSLPGEYHVLSFSEDGNTVTLDDTGVGLNSKYFNSAIIINNRDVLVIEMTKIAYDNQNRKLSFSAYDDEQWGADPDVIKGMKKFAKCYLGFEKDESIKIGDISEWNEDGGTEYMISEVSVSDTLAEFTLSDMQDIPASLAGHKVVTISRTVPEMDHICEKDNRLFGVCNKDNSVVASRLGQPLNFRYFSGTSLDSYSVEVGSDGEFTGIATYAGNVILFKERYIHMLTGVKPSMYRLEGIETYGCQKGSEDSICSLSGRLIYKSPGGIYMFDGGYPACISKVFGTERYNDAFASDDDRRYYISMVDAHGKRRLYVYDTYSGFWHIEDSERAVSMCEISGEVFIAYVNHIEKIGNGDGKVSWFAQFGPFDLHSANKKVISGVTLRYKLPQRSSLCIEVSVDGGEYEVMREVYYTMDTVLECDIPLRRCSEFSLRLSGVGDVEVRGISFKLREGAGTR